MLNLAISLILNFTYQKKIKPKIKYIGKRITYLGLKDTILDEKLTESGTIILNSKNFDDIFIEYLGIYKESMAFPHLLLGVLIKENREIPILKTRIGIIKNDSQSKRDVNTDELEYNDGEIFYRCGWCGNVVNERGIELEGYQREQTINYIENNKESIVHQRNGSCCPNGHV